MKQNSWLDFFFFNVQKRSRLWLQLLNCVLADFELALIVPKVRRAVFQTGFANLDWIPADRVETHNARWASVFKT